MDQEVVIPDLEALLYLVVVAEDPVVALAAVDLVEVLGGCQVVVAPVVAGEMFA